MFRFLLEMITGPVRKLFLPIFMRIYWVVSTKNTVTCLKKTLHHVHLRSNDWKYLPNRMGLMKTPISKKDSLCLPISQLQTTPLCSGSVNKVWDFEWNVDIFPLHQITFYMWRHFQKCYCHPMNILIKILKQQQRCALFCQQPMASTDCIITNDWCWKIAFLRKSREKQLRTKPINVNGRQRLLRKLLLL